MILAPKLLTLRVGFHEPRLRLLSAVELPRCVIPAAQRAAAGMEFFPMRPDKLGALSRIQHGEGYRVGHGSTIIAWEFYYMAGQVNARHNPENLWYLIFHEIRKVGVWSWAKVGAEKRLWSADEIVEKWPVGEYPVEVLEEPGPEGAERWRSGVWS